MKFGPVPLDEAKGAILAHTQRLPGDGTIGKGVILTAEHLARLRAAGRQEVVVARLESGDVHEDEAASALGAAIVGASAFVGAARAGRVNVFAKQAGLLNINVDAIHAVNAVNESLAVSTLAQHAWVQSGELIATVKVIPYAVKEADLQLAQARARTASGSIQVAAFQPLRTGLILSQLPGLPQRLFDDARKVQTARVVALGGTVDRVEVVPHDAESVAEALSNHERDGLDLVLFLGASGIMDRQDVLPDGLVRAGGEVSHLGMPVDPGNLLLVGQLRSAMVIGVPGCARSPKVSGFDWVLRRIFAGLPVGRNTLRSMGVGGLLKEHAIREPTRTAVSATKAKIGVVLLAAGQSSRMGGQNKLLADLDGRPIIRRTVETMLASRARPVVVVTGHMSKEIEAALSDLPLMLAHNPESESGMSTSLRVGLDALPGDVDGAMIALADMPYVSPRIVEMLCDAFSPDAGAPICQPRHQRRRGHPVVWAKRYFPELKKLVGDVGGRSVLERHADDVHFVDVDHPGIHTDIDTPEALQDAREGKL